MKKRKLISMLSLFVLFILITACAKNDSSGDNQTTVAPSITTALLDKQSPTKAPVPNYISPVLNAGSNFYPNTVVKPGEVIYENDFEALSGNVIDPTNTFNNALLEASSDASHSGRESILVKGRQAGNSGSGLRISSANGLDPSKLVGANLKFSVWVYYEDASDKTAPDSIDFIIWNRLNSMGTKEDGTVQYEQVLKKTVKKGKWTILNAKVSIVDITDNEMILIGTAEEEMKATGYLTEYYIDDMKLEVTSLTTVDDISPLSNINLPSVFRSIFNDEMSAKNVEEGRIQEIGITQYNDKLSATLVASMGDEKTNIVLFEFKPLIELSGDIKGIKVSAMASEQYLDKYNRFDSGIFDVYEVIDEDGNKRYFGKYHISTQLREELPKSYAINILDISYDLVSDNDVASIADFNFEFVPNYSILKPLHKLAINQVIKSNGTDFNVDYIQISQYETLIYFTFRVESDSIHRFSEAIKIWEAFTGLFTKINPNDKNGVSLVRLYVNDNEIKLNPTDNGFWPWETENEDVNECACYLVFPGIDYDEANKVEIHYKDVVIPIEMP